MKNLLIYVLFITSIINAQVSPQQRDLMNFEPGELIVKLKDEVDTKVYYSKSGKATSNFNIGQLLGIDDKIESSSVMFHQKGIEASIVNKEKMKAVYAAKAATNPNNGYQPKEPLTMKNVFVLKTSDQQENILQLIQQIKDNPNVEYVEPNYIYGIDNFEVGEIITAEEAAKLASTGSLSPLTPNDPLYSSQTNITSTNIDDVWGEYTTGDGSQIIAILDTGVDYTHPDLEANIWINEAELNGVEGYDDDANGYVDDIRGWDFINQDNAPLDDNMHGTHVAGIAGAVGNNGIGIAGAAWNVKLMPLKVFQSNGQGNSVTISESVEYASSNGATIINMSFASRFESITLRLALENAYATSILVAAAGNSGVQIGPCPICAAFFPAAYSFVLGIEDWPRPNNGGYTNFDNDGPIYTAYQYLYNYELKAPGKDIISTIPNGGYANLSGTSMATPLVAGALALYAELKPEDSKELIMGNLINTGGDPYADFLEIIEVEPEPRLALLGISKEDDINDQNNNGYWEPGETIELLPLIKNYWGPTDDVRVGIEFAAFEDTSKATIIQNEIQIGSISAYATLQDLEETLKITISDGVVNKTIIKFVVSVWSGPDQEYMSNPISYSIEVTNAIIWTEYITEDMTITNEKEWIFQNSMIIANGASLTIEAGAIIRMSSQAKIIVCPTCSIFSNGTAEDRVTITGVSGPGLTDAYTYWGGVIIEYNNETYGNLEAGDGTIIAKYGTNTEILNSLDDVPNSIAFQRAKFYYTNFEYARGVGVSGIIYKGPMFFQDCSFLYHLMPQFGYFMSGSSQNSRFIDRSVIQYNTFSTQSSWGQLGSGSGALQRNNNWIYNQGSWSSWVSSPPSYAPFYIDEKYLSENYNPPFYNGHIGTNITNNITSPGSPGTLPSTYLQMYGNSSSITGVYPFPNQLWFGTGSTDVLSTMFYDYTNPRQDGQAIGLIDYTSAKLVPFEENHAVVWKVEVNGYDAQDEYALLDPLGVGSHEFKVYFNRAMDTSVNPQVSYGVIQPYNQTIMDDGSWSENGKIYTVTHDINIGAADGINRIRVQDAQDLDNFKITVYDKRFNFLLQSAGSASAGWYATSGLGKIDLEWVAPSSDVLDDALGYNMYRYEVDADGVESDPVKLNDALIIEDTDESTTGVYYTDFNVVEGQTYFYKYNILRTSFETTDYSSVVSTAPLTSTLGDSNGDFTVDVMDLVHDVDYILGNNPTPFIFLAGDVNADLAINVLDIVGTVDIILNPSSASGSSVGSNGIQFYPSQAVGNAIFTWEGNDLYVASNFDIGGVQLAFNTDFEYVLSEDLPTIEHLDYTQEDSKILMLYSFNNTTIASSKTKILTRQDASQEFDIEQAVVGTTTGSKLNATLNNGTLSTIDAPFQSNKLQFLNLYPNPSKGLVNLEYYLPEQMDQVVVKVYDMLGRMVHIQVLENREGISKTPMELSRLKTGNYIVLITANKRGDIKNIANKKLIVK
jgi:subtilisin family serine protease